MIYLWNVDTGVLKTKLTGHPGGVSTVAFNQDGKILTSGSSDSKMCLWDTTTGTHKATLLERGLEVRRIVFSPNGHQLASRNADGTIRLWDAATLHQTAAITGHLFSVSTIAFSPDSRTLASGSWDQKLQLWDLATRNNKAALTGHINAIRAIAFSPDGKTLASGGWDSLRLWDIATATQNDIFVGHRGGIYDLVFSPDGKTLVSASHDQKVCLWDTATGYQQATLTWQKTNSYSTSNLAFSADGETLAIADRTGIRLCDAKSRPYKVRRTIYTPVQSFAFSLDGKTLAGGTTEGRVILWDAISGEEKATLTGHTEWVGSVAFSPDGETLASTGWHQDRTIRLWDVATGSHKLTLTGHTERISSLGFSPDGKMLASGSDDGTILLWEYPLAQLTPGAPTRLANDTNADQMLNAVLQNYPNPFNPETWIPYQLAEPAEVTVRIYTANGTLIRTLAVGHRSAGTYQHRHNAVYWDGKNEMGEPVSSGVYFYLLTAGEFNATRKMVIRK
ncbi:T9SS type A sorting domain-containing protein [Candidatus Poribacteria bacterium]|nr:T9SS type A sorting domain-containing protein [Candidatus Poribacteria bacterium]